VGEFILNLSRILMADPSTPVIRRPIYDHQILVKERVLQAGETQSVEQFLEIRIEALDVFADNPVFWLSGDDAVLYHHTNTYLVLKSIQPYHLELLRQSSYVVIEEKHRAHYSDMISPYGMQRGIGGTGRIYEVEIISPQSEIDVRSIFNRADL
jgi:hypothetical protein